MFKHLRAAAFAVVLVAPAYAAAKPNPLPADLRQSLFVKDVVLVWSVDDTKSANNADYASFKEDLQTRLKATVEQSFLNSPAGHEAVELRVDVKTFQCDYVYCRVEGDVSVVQLSDGKELGVYQKVRGQKVAGGGLLGAVIQASVKPDVVGISSNAFAGSLRAKFDAKK